MTRTRFLFLVVVLLLVGLSAFSLEDLSELNGRHWKDFNDTEKLHFVRGFMIGQWSAVSLLMHYDTYIEPGLLEALDFRPSTDIEIVSELNDFYSHSEMLEMPIWQAIYIRNYYKETEKDESQTLNR